MPKIKKDLIGRRFGKLVVTDAFIKEERKKIKWLCKCDCGNKKYIARDGLLSGKTQSCGCIRAINELSKTKIYKTWANMKYRCFNENAKAYMNYGGKGIIVCEEWLDFMVFYEWANKNGYNDTLTIDRINSDKNYTPDNCRWISKSENTAYANKNTHRRKVKFWYYGISPSNEYYEFDNASEFARNYNLNDKLIRAMANKTKYKNSKYNGWIFGFTEKEIL